MENKTYDEDTQFFCIFAISGRANIYHSFEFKGFENEILGLHDFLMDGKSRSRGEIAVELTKRLEKIYGDGYEYVKVTLVNFYEI